MSSAFGGSRHIRDSIAGNTWHLPPERSWPGFIGLDANQGGRARSSHNPGGYGARMPLSFFQCAGLLVPCGAGGFHGLSNREARP